MIWEFVSFGIILALGSLLRLYDLMRNGFGNPYYSAGVFSMTRNLHNFLFNAFDPAGTLGLDKPPLALWLQVASVKLFGFAPLSVLMPQAVEGMVSVVVVWHLVRRRFGAVAGLLAALLLAMTPISVAVDRSSNTDSCLVMVALLAAWALLAAAERGCWRLLLLAMALIGVGFNIKMTAAFVVLPGFALTYWLGSRAAAGRPAALGRRVLAPAVADRISLDGPPVGSPMPARSFLARFVPTRGGAAVAASCSPIVLAGRSGCHSIQAGAVTDCPDTPARDRGDTQHRCEVEDRSAIRDHGDRGDPGPGAVHDCVRNAVSSNRGRIGSIWRPLWHLVAGGLVCLAISMAWVGPVGLTPATERPFVDNSPANSMFDLVLDHNGLQRFFPRAGARQAQRPAGDPERVPAGPLRLADPRLATQVGWLLPLALIGGLSALAEVEVAAPTGLSLVLWFGWLLGYGVVYSAAGGLFSAYYMVTLAPPLAVLAGVGFASLWRRWRQERRWWWLLPVALGLTAIWQVWLIVPVATDLGGTIDAVTAAESGRTWLALAVMFSVVAAILGLVLAPQLRDAKASAAFALSVLLGAPGLWTAETAFAHIQGARPMAVLGKAGDGRRWRGEAPADIRLAEFLSANARGARFLAATSNARQAAPLIIATGAPVLAMGGFTGNLPVVTLPTLQRLAETGQLRFVLLTEAGRSPDVAGTPDSGRGFDSGRVRWFAARQTAEQQAIAAWVHEQGVLVDPNRWQAQGDSAMDETRPVVTRLYDLAGRGE
jgi:4-amino-4-deoxy-L-arabinose transferase-like glycosyltransferase